MEMYLLLDFGNFCGRDCIIDFFVGIFGEG